MTARERQVAASVARGTTNRGIGAELGVSPRTIEHHVSAILTKLDLRSRHEIIVAAFAGRIPGVVVNYDEVEWLARIRPTPEERRVASDVDRFASALG